MMSVATRAVLLLATAIFSWPQLCQADDKAPTYQIASYGELLLKRYTSNPIVAYAEYNIIGCTAVPPGSFTLDTQPQNGEVTFGTVTVTIGGSSACAGLQVTASALFYKRTAHNNHSAPGWPPGGAADYFHGNWHSSDGIYNPYLTGRPTVPIVRPVGEKTEFTGWDQARGLWKQTLTPPSDDPNFDFSGEFVRETHAAGTTDTDSCFDGTFGMATLSATQPWTVQSGNTWGPDGVGYGTNDNACSVEYYRCVKKTPCGFALNQQMQISSPADNGTFMNYGPVNVLKGGIEGYTVPIFQTGVGNVTSSRASQGPRQTWYPSFPLSCTSRGVSLSKC
jgi:hypothetical protein